MKIVIFLLFALTSSLSNATENCLFPPCPTQAEIKESDVVFNKTKYILGAAFDIQNRHTYKNIPEFVSKTKKIKTDLKILMKQAESLHLQTSRIEVETALVHIDMCVSFNQGAIRYCSLALNELKNYLWRKNFGDNWSGYPIMSDWKGFPQTIK